MSGESGGLILLPLALASMPLLLSGLAIAGVVTVGVKAGQAAVRYEKEQRRQREQIRTANTSRSIGHFRNEVNQNMVNQTRLNSQASEQMMRELENQRSAMKRVAEQQDARSFQTYVSNLSTARAQTMRSMETTQEQFNESYRRKITESMASVSQKINEQYAAYIDELRQIKDDQAAKDNKAKEIAKSYIEEARTLLTSLSDDFEGRKFSLRQLTTLNKQLNQAVSLYNSGRYESAIAGAKDVAVNTLEEIYEADAQKQEWDNYFKLALVLSEEVKTYLDSQAVVTREAKEYAEKASGKTLEDEIVGIRIADYAGKNAKGENRFDCLTAKVDDIYSSLRSPSAQQLTTQQLKDSVSRLNGEIYPEAAQCVSGAIFNMNNAFSRQNISEEIIDFFEEHNFTFNGYAYDEDSHDRALHIGLENEASGEELIITLAPELLSGGEVQTHIDLKQIKGDEANEQRKAYYRESVESIVKGSNPYAKVDIKCKAETRNKLSADTETKKKLKQ